MNPFTLYANILLEENKKYNLTAITDEEEMKKKHFEDSLLLRDITELPQGASLLDVGSGAGFPGVPLKIVRPDLRLTLLESSAKKAAFLRMLSQRLSLPWEVINERAEIAAHQPEQREQYDWVVSRAVAALPVLCELCLPFCRPGGCFAAYKGTEERARQELTQAQNALNQLGAIPKERITTLTEYGERTLVILEKISQTPMNYPRNHGAMRKRPL